MKNKEKNGWIAFLITVVINVVSSLAYAVLEKVDFFTAFKRMWMIIINNLKNILFIEIKLWQIALVLFVVALSIRAFNIYKNKNHQTQDIPEFMNFTTGAYKGIYYKWSIYKDYWNRIKIENFRPVCDCGAEITFKNSHNNRYYGKLKLFCVNCDKIIENDFSYEIEQDAKLYFSNKLNKKIDMYNKSLNSNSD